MYINRFFFIFRYCKDGLVLNILISAPVNCEWNEWKIGQCSKSCDGGLRNKTRTIMKKESNKGKCEGNATAQETCSLNNCSSQFIFNTYFLIGKYKEFFSCEVEYCF